VYNRANGGDWAADLVAPQGTPVYLYAAPQNTARPVPEAASILAANG
jgi:hypothetical protein